MSKIRVMIVDDHPVFAQGLAALLADEADLEIVSVASDGAQAIEMLEKCQPHVVVLDVHLPGRPGPAVAADIRAKFPGVQILGLSGFSDDESIQEMITAGVLGYVLKDAPAEEIARGIRLAAVGQSYLAPSVARTVIEHFSRLESMNGAPPRIANLSQREIDVLRLVAVGESNKSIARRLFLSERTVENHVYNLYRKINVRDRTQAMLFAVRNGLVELNEAEQPEDM